MSIYLYQPNGFNNIITERNIISINNHIVTELPILFIIAYFLFYIKYHILMHMCFIIEGNCFNPNMIVQYNNNSYSL